MIFSQDKEKTTRNGRRKFSGKNISTGQKKDMDLGQPFNPLERADEVEKIVVKGARRKYYRFRAAAFYGGLATADAVGCCFLCAYCWNLGRNFHPERAGEFYSGEEVARILLDIAGKKGFRQVRISGAEPILGRETFQHLLEILEAIRKEAPATRFILETNGFLLGYDKDMARELARFQRLLIRISLKAVEPEKFERITGAQGHFYFYPLQALINLKEAGAHFWPAVMSEFFSPEDRQKLKDFLRQNHLQPEIEEEELILYPSVEENLKSRGFKLF